MVTERLQQLDDMTRDDVKALTPRERFDMWQDLAVHVHEGRMGCLTGFYKLEHVDQQRLKKLIYGTELSQKAKDYITQKFDGAFLAVSQDLFGVRGASDTPESLRNFIHCHRDEYDGFEADYKTMIYKLAEKVGYTGDFIIEEKTDGTYCATYCGTHIQADGRAVAKFTFNPDEMKNMHREDIFGVSVHEFFHFLIDNFAYERQTFFEDAELDVRAELHAICYSQLNLYVSIREDKMLYGAQPSEKLPKFIQLHVEETFSGFTPVEPFSAQVVAERANYMSRDAVLSKCLEIKALAQEDWDEAHRQRLAFGGELFKHGSPGHLILIADELQGTLGVDHFYEDAAILGLFYNPLQSDAFDRYEKSQEKLNKSMMKSVAAGYEKRWKQPFFRLLDAYQMQERFLDAMRGHDLGAPAVHRDGPESNPVDPK